MTILGSRKQKVLAVAVAAGFTFAGTTVIATPAQAHSNCSSHTDRTWKRNIKKLYIRNVETRTLYGCKMHVWWDEAGGRTVWQYKGVATVWIGTKA